jgi:hypothetical protein
MNTMEITSFADALREEVLDAYAVEPVHDKPTLERYLRDYPQFVTELMELSGELSRVIESDESPLTGGDKALLDKAWRAYVRPHSDVTSPAKNNDEVLCTECGNSTLVGDDDLCFDCGRDVVRAAS